MFDCCFMADRHAGPFVCFGYGVSGTKFLKGGRMKQPAFYASEDRRIFISFPYEVVWSCNFGKQSLDSFPMFMIFVDF